MFKITKLLACLSLAGLGTAYATTTTTTVGLTTTYFDNFNNAPSMFTISGGLGNGIFNAGSDDYLLLINNGTASFTFNAALPLASVDISFWYSQNDTGATASFASGTINLPDTTSGGTLVGAVQYAANNPGAGGSTNDAFNSSFSLTGLGPGAYTLTFAAPSLAQNLTGVKFDDVTIAVTAVPEPSSYALMMMGLAGIWVARRRVSR